MAQTGYTPILIYSSSTGGNTPAAGSLTNSTLGSELAINIADGKLFYKDTSNAVQVIAWKTTPTTAGGTGLTSYSAGDLLYYATGTTLAKLTIGASGTILKSTGSAPAWETVANLAVESISFGTTGLTPATATKGAVTVAGTLVAANGGTGLSSYTTGDLLYASGTTTLAKLADVATGNALISGGVGVAPSWGKIGLTTHVSGTLPTANGGTNLTSFTANGVVYASSTSALATSANLAYNGTDLTLTGGNFVVGTSGKGIDFSATPGTGTSELFSDYEEGTWTPGYEPETGSFTSISYGFAAGRYTRIGNLVCASWYMRTSALTKGAASGAVFIKNLPFVALNAAPSPWIALGVGVDFLVNNARAAAISQNTDKLLLQQDRNNISIFVTDLGTGGADNFTAGQVSYYVA